MSEQNLAEILNQLREERVACEQVLASVHRLAARELKGVFDKAITLAKLEAQIANPDISGEVTMAMSNATTQLTFVSSQLEDVLKVKASKKSCESSDHDTNHRYVDKSLRSLG